MSMPRMHGAVMGVAYFGNRPRMPRVPVGGLNLLDLEYPVENCLEISYSWVGCFEEMAKCALQAIAGNAEKRIAIFRFIFQAVAPPRNLLVGNAGEGLGV